MRATKKAIRLGGSKKGCGNRARDRPISSLLTWPLGHHHLSQASNWFRARKNYFTPIFFLNRKWTKPAQWPANRTGTSMTTKFRVRIPPRNFKFRFSSSTEIRRQMFRRSRVSATDSASTATKIETATEVKGSSPGRPKTRRATSDVTETKTCDVTEKNSFPWTLFCNKIVQSGAMTSPLVNIWPTTNSGTLTVALKVIPPYSCALSFAHFTVCYCGKIITSA